MTLATTVSRVEYPGAGSAGPFAFPFRIVAETDLRVTQVAASGVETRLVLTSEYTVTGVGDAAGTVTLVTALAVGETLVIRRVRPLTQASSVRNQAAYAAATHEDAWDDAMMKLQDMQDQLDRSFGILESLAGAGRTLRIRPVAGRVLGWTSDTVLDSVALDDASNVMLPAGGRTVTTLTQYLANNAVYNVKDFGATGDGVTNDVAAIQAAIDAAALTGGMVWFPPGHYICENTLAVVGYGITLQGAGNFGGSDIRGTRIELTSQNRDLLQIKSSETVATQAIVVQDIYFTGPGAAAGATGHGIHTYCSSATALVLGRVELRRIAVSNFREHGVFFDGTLQHGGTWFQTLKQFVVSLNGKDGVRLDSLIQSVVEDGYCLDNGNYGLNITGRNGAADYVSKAITVTRVSSETSGFYNLNLESCTGISLREIWLESPTLGQARFCSAQAIRWMGGQGAVEQAPSTYKGIYFTQNAHADPNSDIYIDVPNFDVHSTKKLVTFDGLAVTFSGGPVRFGRMGNNSNPEISRWINPDDITDFATYLNVIDFEGAGLRIVDPTTAQNAFAVYGEKNGVYGILGFRNATGYFSFYGNGAAHFGGVVDVSADIDLQAVAGKGLKLKSPDGLVTKTLQLSNAGAVALV